MGQLIAIVGRPNVGKSTLFNRLTESRTAIVDETAAPRATASMATWIGTAANFPLSTPVAG